MHINPNPIYYYYKIYLCVVDEHCSSPSAVTIYIGRYLHKIYNLRTTSYYTYLYVASIGNRISLENRYIFTEKNNNVTRAFKSSGDKGLRQQVTTNKHTHTHNIYIALIAGI